MSRFVRLVSIVLFGAVPIWALAAPVLAQSAEELEAEVARLETRLRELKEGASAIESRFETEGGAELRIYGVQDLLMRLNDFRAPALKLKPAGAEFDDDRPQFGVGREGPSFFGPDELADLVRSLAPTAVWDAGGDIEVSSRVLIVAAPPEVHRRVQALLRELRADLGRLVTVEVRVLRARSLPAGPLTAEATEKLLERLEAGEDEGVLASAEVTGYTGQALAVFDGTQTAFVQDYDLEVAEEATIHDPIVGVARHGLVANVRALPRGDAGTMLLDIRADVSLPRPEGAAIETVAGPVGRVEQELLEVRATVNLPDGGSIVLGGTSAGSLHGARAALLVRARTFRPPAATAESDRVAELRRAVAVLARRVSGREEAAGDAGPLFRTRLYAVGDLVFVPADHRGPSLDLTSSARDSAFAAEGPVDPVPFFQMDELVELVRNHVARGSWDELASARISTSGDNLVVSHTAGAHADVSALLHELRGRASQLVELDVDVLRISDADRRSLLAESGGAPVLAAAARARLAAWIDEGRVRRIHEGRIVAQSGQRTALVDLTRDAYVQDIDVGIAKGAPTGDPVMGRVPEGLVVDVWPVATSDGSSVVVEACFQRSRLFRPLPSFETRLGAVHVPRLRATRVFGTLTVASGATIVLGGGVETATSGDHEGCLVLLTPRVIRGGG